MSHASSRIESPRASGAPEITREQTLDEWAGQVAKAARRAKRHRPAPIDLSSDPPSSAPWLPCDRCGWITALDCTCNGARRSFEAALMTITHDRKRAS